MSDKEQQYHHPFEKLRRQGKTGINKIRILKYLFESEIASVNQICDATRISTPTVLLLLNQLINSGYVERKGMGKSNSQGGRRPDLFGLIGNFYILCIDVELFATHITIIDNTLARKTEITTFPYALSKDRDGFKTILERAKNIIKSSKIPMEKMIGVGICMPGLINTKTGENYGYLTNKNDEKTLQEYCESFFGMPVTIQNYVKSATLSELRYGKAKGKQDVLVLLMNWGVGVGIIMDGKVRKGTSGFSGEIGHIPFEENGDLCYCGKHGCLETVASGMVLAKMAKAGIEAGQNSILKELWNQDIDKIEPRVIVNAANKGDMYATKLLSHIGSNIGKSISTLIQVFNPELIILGGKMAVAKDYITIPMLQSMNTYCMLQIREKAEIVSSNLGEYANLLGCAIESMDRAFEKKMA